jgi:signal transduction histidine kinase
VSSDGIVSTVPATVAFTILRPVWQRWWFIALALLGTALAVHAAYRYRLARLLQLANLRTRIATDLHDDVGANLTRISFLTEVARRQRDDLEQLASIATIARESVSAMSDIVWAINPSRETLGDLVRRMRRHAEEIFTLREIDLQFAAPNERDELRLGVDVRRDLLLIFKEAVSNAARHSACCRVAIDLGITGTQLTLAISDDGKGFDPSVESEGQGLRSMRGRAARLQADLEVTSRAGRGTSVTLRLRL